MTHEKKSKYPPTNEWINKKLYIYTIECYSAMKTNEKNAICSNMDVTKNYHSK